MPGRRSARPLRAAADGKAIARRWRWFAGTRWPRASSSSASHRTAPTTCSPRTKETVSPPGTAPRSGPVEIRQERRRGKSARDCRFRQRACRALASNGVHFPPPLRPPGIDPERTNAAIARTRMPSSTSAQADDRMRGKAITPICGGARSLAVECDRPGQVSPTIASGQNDHGRRLAHRPIGTTAMSP